MFFWGFIVYKLLFVLRKIAKASLTKVLHQEKNLEHRLVILWKRGGLKPAFCVPFPYFLFWARSSVLKA